MSTTLTYFVVRPSLSVASQPSSTFPPSPLPPCCPILAHFPLAASSFSVEIAIVIAIILFLLLLLCTSIRDIRTCPRRESERASAGQGRAVGSWGGGENEGARRGGRIANGIKRWRDGGRAVTQFKSRGRLLERNDESFS